MNKLEIERINGKLYLTVDGATVECSTEAEIMSRTGAELGTTYAKAQHQLFERMEAAEKLADELEQKITDYAEITAELQADNAMLKSAIVACFLRAFKEG